MHKRTVGFDDNTGLLAVVNDRALPGVDIWVEQYLRDTDSMEEYTLHDKKITWLAAGVIVEEASSTASSLTPKLLTPMLLK